MSLHEEMRLFTELSGEDGVHTSIARIGGYLDGYERGKADSKWIPAAERLPEAPKCVDVYWCSECGDVAADEYIVMIKGATLPTALFWDGKHWFDINGEQTLYPVVAWMQFPEAYKGEE